MFRRPTNHYGRAPEPVTPYPARRADLGRSHRLGAGPGEELAARLLRLPCALGRAGLGAGLAVAARHDHALGVEVDKLGEARAVAPADADYRRPIRRSRSISRASSSMSARFPADPVVLRATGSAPMISHDDGRAGAQRLCAQQRPFAEVGKRQVAVDVSSVIRASKDSFRIAWTERRYQDGALSRPRAGRRS
jgi:type IV secretory pathway TrbF-like protein